MNSTYRNGSSLQTSLAENRIVGNNGVHDLLPNRIPPDIYSWIIYVIAGAVGALVKNVGSGEKVLKILLDMICGAFCSVFCADLLAEIILHCLIKFDLIQHQVASDKLIGFAGFICGVAGMRLMTLIIEWIARKLN